MHLFSENNIHTLQPPKMFENSVICIFGFDCLDVYYVFVQKIHLQIYFVFSDTMFPCTDEGYYSHDPDSHYVETWKAMEKLVDSGKTRSIGLSNFNRTQVQEILDIPGAKYKPAVLQNESHPYLQEKDLRDFCRLNGIAFQVIE